MIVGGWGWGVERGEVGEVGGEDGDGGEGFVLLIGCCYALH